MSKDKQIKYFLYARESSKNNGQKSASTNSRINELIKLVSGIGLNVIKTFVESRSAKERKRPIFNQMIREIENGDANGILCWKVDHLSRKPLDASKIIDLFQKGLLQEVQIYEKNCISNDTLFRG